MEIFVALIYYFTILYNIEGNDKITNTIFRKENFIFWPNGTIPFYIKQEHFDKEQSLAIMTSLSLFTFKTCLQFNPVLVEPQPNRHVMVFENPRGVRKCSISMEGHAKEEPHRILLGYDCLKSPKIDMLVMKALGFPFEHNRASRDVFVDVQFENIEPGHIPLFTKERKLPLELRSLPYDINSVMHFGERDFSKNGHRTIIFKTRNTRQNRIGLSKTDLRKIEIIYGQECLKRERQAKMDMCRSYPSSRKKREIDVISFKNLRVNRDITPPPENNLTEKLSNTLEELGVEDEVQGLIEQVYKITASALENSRTKYCNGTTISIDTEDTNNETRIPNDIRSVIEATTLYIRSAVQNSLINLTLFCDNTNSIEIFQRVRCGYGNANRCPVNYKSTKSGQVKYSTQHRPIIIQSTKHEGKGRKPQYDSSWLRYSNRTEVRRKRDLSADTADKRNITLNKVVQSEGTTNMTVLRMGTTISVQKVVNFAPVRRYEERGPRIYGSKEKQEDTSNWSSENSKAILKRDPMKSHIEIKPSKKERYREKETSNIDEEEERPKSKRIKKRKERKRIEVPETVQLSKANKEFYAERIWPGGIVRYIISDDSNSDMQSMRARLAEVNDILKRRTCVSIEEVSERAARRYSDYLVLDTSADYVTGRVGGRQNFGCIELFEGGQHRQHAAMMVMAMLGFYFEVSRHDRDKYVRVHMRHIRADKLHHFEKIRSDATLPTPYDYKSATHPAWQFWRKVGRTGIAAVATYKDQDPDGSIMKSLGQNVILLSDTDILKINSVYGVRCFHNKRTEINE